MKMTLVFTPAEVGEAICAFGVEALVAVKLYKWFGFDNDSRLPNHSIVLDEKSETIPQIVYEFLHNTIRHEELYATCEVKLKDGRLMNPQQFTQIASNYLFENSFDEQAIASMVESATAVIEIK
jgi:hypothetical protein